ncbi:cytochrome P450 [Flagelloscypha sp. PMI_526]|nr:cytochrome P450 [Flagelloscypha sp. PMI_526]
MFLILLPIFGLFLHLIWPFLTLLVRQHVSPLRRLRGPPNPSFFLGNLMEMHDQENTDLIARWEKEYGSVFTYRGFVGGCRLMITDPVAIAHILAHAAETRPGEGAYEKPDFVRDSLATMAAGHEGLVTVEGEQHKRQRKILTPAFSSSHMKSLTPIFWEKAIQLRDVFLFLSQDQTSFTSPPTSPTFSSGTYSSGAASPTGDTPDYPVSQPFHIPFLRQRRVPKNIHTVPSSPVESSLPTPPTSPPAISQTSRGMRIDVLSYLSRATLDVIGLSGFGYNFDSLPHPEELDASGKREGKKDSELAKAFSVIFSSARKFRAMTILQVWFPFLRRFRRNSATMDAARASMEKIGLQLIEERTSKAADKDDSSKDLLSLLIRSNTAEQPSHRMTVQEILCQVGTFIAAGHETTSNALSWTLYALVQNPDKQRRLREELQAVHAEIASSFSQLATGDLAVLNDDAMRETLESAISKAPYLDAVIREALRIHAPVTSTMRVCLKEGGDEIPVTGSWGTVDSSNENKKSAGGYLDKNGVLRDTIRVNKWDIITIPIQAVNKSVALWGEDAALFRPERWENVPPAVKSISGIYSNTLSFLGGSRSCIGYKFALTEMKIFLYVLLKDMEFFIDPSMVIEKKVK